MSKKPVSATKTLVFCAVFTALAIILARFLSITPSESVRFSFETIPIFLSGVLFGPVAGAMVGFASDFIGSLFTFGFNPLFCLPPILFGLCGGFARPFLQKKLTFLRLLLVLLPPVVFGSVLWQSFVLSRFYGSGYWVFLSSRSLQFAAVTAVDTLLLFLLFRSRVFTMFGLWNRKAMTHKETMDYIHSTSWKGSVPGLGRTEQLLFRMGDPHKKLKFIHIVGTNGKGSTAAMLSSILRKAGYTVGLYTSPYIYKFNERMQVNGEAISDEELAEITAFVRPLAETMRDAPTEFELITCIAFEFFRRRSADIVVLEAGMGGSLDSTNVIPAPEVAVMCNIGLDHTEYLGDTLEAIAKTKAGVIKKGCRCVLYPAARDVEAAVREKCEQEQVPLSVADLTRMQALSHDLTGQSFLWDKEELKISLLGEHQLKNTAVVLTAVENLKELGWSIPEAAVKDGLAETYWPGRFEVLRKEPLFIVDGGHNPQCMAALVKNIEDYLPDTDLTVLTGVMADKEVSSMYPPLLPYAKRFVTVTPANPRAMKAEALKNYLTSLGCEATACDTVAEGAKAAIELARAKGGAVLACGSLYMIAEVAEGANNAE